MSNIKESAEKISEIVNVFRCPLCHSSMKVMNLKSIICLNNHTFDIAKQGYINMMIRPANSHYDKQSKLSYSKELNQAELMKLIQMSPLTWNVKKEQLDLLINQGSSEITVDLDILVGA